MKNERPRVAIIGAGSSGLACARQALLYGFEPTVFEKRDAIGGWWRFDSDPQTNTVAHTTSALYSKNSMGFSDYIPPKDSSMFMPHTQVLEYLEGYASAFQLLPRIKSQTEVVGVKRAENWTDSGIWIVDYLSDGMTEPLSEEFNAVLVCSGMHTRPWRPPPYRLEKAYKGRITHSANYKNSVFYHQKRVAIVGFGNSAVGIACDLATVAKEVFLVTRRGSWLVPSLDPVSGQPWDCAYNNRLHSMGRCFVPKLLQNYLWERQESIDHKGLGIRPTHRFLAANFTFAQSLPLHILSGRVVIRPDLLSFTETGLEFVDRSVQEPIDEVIFCTGFEFDFPFVEGGSLIRVRYNDFHLFMHMFLPDLSQHNNLAVIGHVQPTGPSFPVAEMQSRLFFHVLSGQAKLPSQFEMKAQLERRRCDMSLDYVKTRRHTQIEDSVAYTDSLASMIGAKPNLVALLPRNPRLVFKILFGPPCPSQYRLAGTHKWIAAGEAVMHTCTLKRRQVVFMLVRLIIALIFANYVLKSIC